MKEFTLDIYKGNKKVKTVKAKRAELTMGVVRKLTNLINFEKEKTAAEMNKLMFDLWNPLTELLGVLFPDVTEEEWDGVRVKDMIKLIMDVTTAAVSEALEIPTDGTEKNHLRGKGNP